MSDETVDVIVVGSGNAGFSAAASAIENGAQKVVLLEKAPETWVGGNTTFTAGAYRTAFTGLDDLLPLPCHNVTPELAKQIDMNAYSEEDFWLDLQRVTNGRADPVLGRALVKESNATTKWLASNGIKFRLSFERQAYKINNRYKFWGGLVLSVVDGGKGLTAQHKANVLKKGLDLRYESPVVGLLSEKSGTVSGVTVQRPDNSTYNIRARGGVVLCAGGFEANPSMRAQYLGPNWDLAYVRGTPYNTGDLLKIAIDELGARPAGNWSGCHSTCWDANAPHNAGDQALTNQFTKSGYPLGLMFNADGERFVDEGQDMRNFTYAKFGRAILGQPDGVAFQVWDADGAAWLRAEEYADDVVERISADSIEQLAEKLATRGLKRADAFARNVRAYNDAVAAFRSENPGAIFDPSKKDGVSTRSSKGGLALDKTNWALPIVRGPFVAVKVACGITFTFGGLSADAETAGVVAATTGKPIPGLYCAGEMLGGLFYGNYPGGSGLTAGAVFGRKAGRAAARRAVSGVSSTSPTKSRL